MAHIVYFLELNVIRNYFYDEYKSYNEQGYNVYNALLRPRLPP